MYVPAGTDIWTGQGLQRTGEFLRISRLPRRAYGPDQLEGIAKQMTSWLGQPGGAMSLNLVQAQALFELHHCPGVFCTVRVGGGKTLICFLAAKVARAERPLLLVPAALVDKTNRDARRYGQHFQIPNYLRVMSYELLSRATSLQELERWKPDLVIGDECHYLRSRDAARTSRVLTYFHKHPETRALFLSGTVTRRSIRDFAHLIRLCLRGGAPVPLEENTLLEWAQALDETPPGGRRIGPGMLLDYTFATDEERAKPDGHKAAFRRRLVDTPGVIATEETGVDMPLICSFDRIELPTHVTDEIAKMRGSWETPNGQSFEHAIILHQHVREMGLGFFYYWDPPAPRACDYCRSVGYVICEHSWIGRRKAWTGACRYILSNNQRGLDSPLLVANAVDAGHYPAATEALAKWREIRPTFEPKTKPAWLTFDVVDHVAKECLRDHQIIWTDLSAFAHALAARTGLPYFGPEGKDYRGNSIEDHPGNGSIIASMHSNRAGRNLQDRWFRNYLVNPPPNGEWIEQILGRTHRDHQPSDEVFCRILSTCPEHEMAVDRMILEATHMQHVTGQPQKILLADWTNKDTPPLASTIPINGSPIPWIRSPSLAS